MNLRQNHLLTAKFILNFEGILQIEYSHGFLKFTFPLLFKLLFNGYFGINLLNSIKIKT